VIAWGGVYMQNIECMGRGISYILCSFAASLCKFAIITPYFKLILILYEYKNTIKATT